MKYVIWIKLLNRKPRKCSVESVDVLINPLWALQAGRCDWRPSFSGMVTFLKSWVYWKNQALGQEYFGSASRLRLWQNVKAEWKRNKPKFCNSFSQMFWNLWLEYFDGFHYARVCTDIIWGFFPLRFQQSLSPNCLLQIYITQLVFCVSHWAFVDTTPSRCIYRTQEKVVQYLFLKILKHLHTTGEKQQIQNKVCPASTH